MTKEELKQEARQKALEWNREKINGKYNRPPIANWSCYEKGYLAGAEPREKRIAELEEKFANAESSNEWYRRSTYGSLFNLITKAKEIIKQFLSYEQIPRDCLRERYRKLLEEAEQFISEVEK